MAFEPHLLRGWSLLGVFAHPDDESLACGGLLAWSAALGARVSLVSATRGEHGPQGRTPPLEPDALGEIRGQELRAAAGALGATEVVLLDHEDGMLPWVAPDRLAGDIERLVRRLRPDVVITFGEDGLYWHPDHIAVHGGTTAAVDALGAAAPALYYVSLPPGRMRAIVDHATAAARRAGEPPRPFILGVEDADAFGAQARPPTLIVDSGPFAARKLAALRCHETQFGASALSLVDEPTAVRLLALEHYRRAEVGRRGTTFLDHFDLRRADRPAG